MCECVCVCVVFVKCGGVRAAWADELTHTTHPSQFRLSNWQDPTRPQLPARSPPALSDLGAPEAKHWPGDPALPSFPWLAASSVTTETSRAQSHQPPGRKTTWVGSTGCLREIESVFRLPVDCGPARIFGGLRGDHSEAATRMEAAIAEAARREELPFLRE